MVGVALRSDTRNVVTLQLEQLSYIESELEALESEQQSIDLKASALEKKLRVVMGGGNGESEYNSWGCWCSYGFFWFARASCCSQNMDSVISSRE